MDNTFMKNAVKDGLENKILQLKMELSELSIYNEDENYMEKYNELEEVVKDLYRILNAVDFYNSIRDVTLLHKEKLEEKNMAITLQDINDKYYFIKGVKK